MLRLYPTFDGQRTSLHGRVLVRDEANAFITFEEPRSVGVTVVYHHISYLPRLGIWPEWLEQDPSHAGVVERIKEVALGGIPASGISFGSGAMEAVDGSAHDRPTCRLDQPRQLAREDGLASPVWPIDRHSGWAHRDCPDPSRQLAQHDLPFESHASTGPPPASVAADPEG